MRSRKKKALAGFLFLLSLRDEYGERFVGDGVPDVPPQGRTTLSAHFCHSEPVTVSLAWESASKKGERIAASLRAAKQVPLGYSPQ